MIDIDDSYKPNWLTDIQSYSLEKITEVVYIYCCLLIYSHVTPFKRFEVCRL